MGRPAVFLDRDGTVIVDRGHLTDPDDVELLPGAAEAIHRLNEAGVFGTRSGRSLSGRSAA